MKKIGSVLLMVCFVCFLGGIVGCPATPAPKKETTPAKDTPAKDTPAKDTPAKK